MAQRIITALTLLGLVSLVTGVTGCGADPEGRFKVQRDIGHRVLDDGRLAIFLEPGIQPLVEGPYQLSLQAAAPTPRITIDYTGLEARTLSVVVSNVFDEAIFIPTRTTLSDVGECPPADPAGSIVLAPLTTTHTEPTTHALSIDLLPCTRLAIQVVSGDALGSAGGQPLNLAVIGEVKGNLEVMRKILARIADLDAEGVWSADVLVALGDLANSPDFVDLTIWRAAAMTAELPLVVALGRDELTRSTILPFFAIFGPSDYTFAIGDARFYVIDTASAGMAQAQFAYWTSVMSSAVEPIRLAMMQTMPFDPSGARDAGFTNHAQAAQLVSLLGANGVRWVFTGGLGTYDQDRIGDIQFHYTGGGGRPIEVTSDVDHHFLRVTIDPDAETLLSVEVERVD